MGDKDNPFDFKNRAIFIDSKELPVVEDSVKISVEDEYTEPIPINKMSFSIQVDGDVSNIFAESNPVMHAQDMLDTLKKDLKEFCVSKPPRNRKERRTRARELEKKIARFKAYCKENNIEFKFYR